MLLLLLLLLVLLLLVLLPEQGDLLAAFAIASPVHAADAERHVPAGVVPPNVWTWCPLTAPAAVFGKSVDTASSFGTTIA